MILNLLEKKILYELDQNARLTHTQIAKKVHSNRNVVAYRIKRLEDLGIIRGYFTEINNTALGLSGFRVFFKLANYDKNIENALISEILKDNRVAWAFEVKGKWDLDIIYWCKDRFEFFDLIQNIKYKFNSLIASMEISQIVDIHHYPKDYLLNATRKYSGPKKLERTNYQVNEIEHKIIESISEDSRKDILALSKELNLSINTLKKYLKNLVDKQIILGFRAFIDINNIGYYYFKVHLFLQNYNDSERKALISYLQHDSNVVYLDFYIGGADIEIEYHVKNIDELHKKFERIMEK